jgi:tetratricopeptide (TPR) repeat protein
MTAINQKQIDAYLQGEAELKDLLEVEPAYMEELKGRAQFFVDGGHDERALIMLEMIEELDRSDPMPHLLAAELLLKEGRSDAAQEKIEMVLERDPEHADALVAKAELRIATGDLVEAAMLLGKVIDRDPDATTDAGKRAQSVAAAAHARFESA